jgi:type II secretory pathway component PulF
VTLLEQKPTPTPIDYASSRAVPRRPVTSILLTYVFGFAAGTITLICFCLVPALETVFKDFRSPLPRFTLFCLDFAGWLRNQHGWVYLWTFVVVIPIVVARTVPLAITPTQRRVRRLLGYLLLIALMAAITSATAIGLLLPLMGLVESVSGAHR